MLMLNGKRSVCNSSVTRQCPRQVSPTAYCCYQLHPPFSVPSNVAQCHSVVFLMFSRTWIHRQLFQGLPQHGPSISSMAFLLIFSHLQAATDTLLVILPFFIRGTCTSHFNRVSRTRLLRSCCVLCLISSLVILSLPDLQNSSQPSVSTDVTELKTISNKQK